MADTVNDAEGSDEQIALTDCGDNMRCDQAIQRLYEYLDAEMTRVDLERFRVHLTECQGCLEELDLEEHVKALVRRSCSEQAPQELRARILLQITTVQIRRA